MYGGASVDRGVPLAHRLGIGGSGQVGGGPGHGGYVALPGIVRVWAVRTAERWRSGS